MHSCVVGKKVNIRVFHMEGKVVNIDKKQKRTKNRTLRDATFNWYIWRPYGTYVDTLQPIVQIWFYPGNCLLVKIV